MFKVSTFTHFFNYNDYIALYNSHTDVIAKTANKTLLNNIISNADIYTENPMFQKLKYDGFLVDSSINEIDIAALDLYDNLAERSLSLKILTTEQCNFHCKYCSGSFIKGKMEIETRTQLLPAKAGRLGCG